MSHSDEDNNNSTNTTFADVLATRVSRRRALFGGLGFTTSALLGGFLAGCGDDDAANPSNPDSGSPETGSPDTGAPVDAGPDANQPKPLTLDFDAVAKGSADAVVVPAGYSVTVLYRLGDPIAASVGDYKNDGSDTGESHALRAGDHHDGMHYFGLGANGKYAPTASDRALLVMNHEALTPAFLHVNGPTIVGTDNARIRAVADEVIKEMNSQGVSVIEITKAGATWSYKKDSTFNRRITTSTEMILSGPAAKHALMITKFSQDGGKTRGTVNNCADGYTPWGTYLACEENWAGYFRRLTASDTSQWTAKEREAAKRYGVNSAGRELWATVTPDTADDLYGRWNAEKRGAAPNGSDDYRNVANTFGWVVEIDPFNSTSTPKKRTALGRLAHEGCHLGPVVPGKSLVWYMGCDGRNEYFYKFVSTKKWDPADASGGLAAGDKYMDDGKLYVAKFDADGNGTWLELTFGVGNVTAANPAYAFADQADVLVHTRLAADAAGATKMDRPEWATINPKNGEVYLTLTNTNASSRPIDKVDAANPRFYNDVKATTPNPTDQKGNPNGHVIRLAEAGADAAATSFKWDIYLFGARATADATKVNLSGLTAQNDFSSPDGAWFSHASPGLLWLQTDDGAYTDVTNCMMLAAIPGAVGDGGKKTIANADGSATKSVDTWVGKAPGEAQLRRFLVGPKECEITGIAESPDGKALFVNIQHPGEDTKPTFATQTYGSYWPDGGKARPRSATIVITRNDGGVVGVAS